MDAPKPKKRKLSHDGDGGGCAGSTRYIYHAWKLVDHAQLPIMRIGAETTPMKSRC